MKFYILIFAVTFSLISASVHAKTLIDSIGVRNDDGKKVIVFKVKPKDTYYSIGRRYHVKPAAIMKYNGSKKEMLAIGAIVMVPTDIPYRKSKERGSEKVAKETKKEKKIRLAREAEEERKNKRKGYTEETEAPAATQLQNNGRDAQQSVQPNQTTAQNEDKKAPPLEYKVSPGETLYSIARRFKTTVDNIKKQNNLTSNILSQGQVLMIQPASDAPQTQPVVHAEMQVTKRDSTMVAPVKDSSGIEHHVNENRFGLYEKSEKGVATWIDDPGLDPNKKLVLHRTAPIGTVIKITNPMTNRTTFAKVVGRFTENESTKDVIIVMTKNVADALGAMDKRFYVNISYGSPNE
jgi:LysM repeat protein